MLRRTLLRADRRSARLVASALASLALAPSAAAEPPPAPEAAVKVELLPMPAVGAVRSIAGSSPRDVWILGDGADLVHHDGARVLGTERGICREKGDPSLGPDLRWVVPGARGPKLVDATSVPGESTLVTLGERSAGRWTCKGGDRLTPQVLAQGGGATWYAGCAVAADVYCMAASLDEVGPQPMLPWLGSPVTALWLGGPTAAWLSRHDGTFEWNGVAWHRRGLPAGFGRVWQLWRDELGTTWALGASQGGDAWDPPAALDRLARFVAGRWEPVALPPGFEPRVLAGTSSRAVWLLGDGVGWLWDGAVWRRAALPPAGVRAAWSAPDGSVWVGGASASAPPDAAAPAAPADPGAGPRAVVFRIVPAAAAAASAGGAP